MKSIHWAVAAILMGFTAGWNSMDVIEKHINIWLAVIPWVIYIFCAMMYRNKIAKKDN